MFRERKNNYIKKITAWICLSTFITGIFYSGPGMSLSAQGGSVKASSANTRGGMLVSSGARQEVGGSLDAKEGAIEDALVVGVKSAARVVVRRDALAQKTTIYGRTLTSSEVPAMKQGMVNATAGETGNVEAYEFLPHGTKFKKPVKIYLPYDPRFIPKDMGEESLFTYFYDEESKQWIRLERVGVDKKEHYVISLTTHFTKMVNATLKLPESPQALSYNPNSLKDIKAADPSAGITMIEQPKGGAFGTNNLNYPIEVPPGRAGQAPQLSIAYNSGGANGWLGVGWDLSIPSITHDTKFGVPRYDGNDTYLFNGQELVLAEVNGNDRRYVMRVEGSFQRIIRHGSTVGDYTWEVTDKNGNRTFYGSDVNSQVKSNRSIGGKQPVYQWNLSESVDLNNNCVDYQYENKEYTEANKIPAVEVTPLKITYTGVYSGKKCTGGKYSVNFETDGIRPDKISNAKSKFKMIVSKRLTDIRVKFNDTLIKRYKLSYSTGNSAHKSIITRLEVFDAANQPFYDYKFSYEDMDGSGEQYNAFSAVKEYNDGMGYDEIYGTTQSSLLSDLTKLISPVSAGLSYSESYSLGGGLDLGFETKFASSGFDISGSISGSSGGNLSRYLLMDINGDNLPDQVLKRNYQDNKFTYRQNDGSNFSAPGDYKSNNVTPIPKNPFAQTINSLHQSFDAIKPVVSVLQTIVSILNAIPTWLIPGIGNIIAGIVAGVDTGLQAIQAVTTVIAVMDIMPFGGLKEYATVDNNNSFTYGGGVTAKVGPVSISYSGSTSLSFTDSRITFQDINGDGFVDQLVLDDSGKIRYKINNGNKIEEGAEIVSPGVDAPLLPEDEVRKIKERFFLTEAVRRWSAPVSGVILINGKVKRISSTESVAKDGVNVKVNHELITIHEETRKDQEGNIIKDDKGKPVKVKVKDLTLINPHPLWEKTIDLSDSKYYAHSIEVHIRAGESIAFRVNSIDNASGDTVEWTPEIRYLSIDRGVAAFDASCDPLIDSRCTLRGKKYSLPDDNLFSSEQDFYLRGTPYFDVKKSDPHFDKLYSQYDTYNMDTYFFNQYRGWNYEEWNALTNKHIMDMNANGKEHKYVGGAGENTYITKTKMNPSRVGGEQATASLPLSGSSGGGGQAPQFIRKSVNTSISKNISVVGVGGSYSEGSTDTKVDWADMNGDRYPDLLISNGPSLMVAMNNHGTGFLPPAVYANGIGIRQNKDTSLAINAGSDGLVTVINSYGGTKEVKAPDVGTSKPAPGVGFSGGLTFGASQSSLSLMDINGDGLADQVKREGDYLVVNLNYGDSFSASADRIKIGSVTLNGISSFLGGDLGSVLSKANLSINTGDSLNFSTTYSGYFKMYPTPGVDPDAAKNENAVKNRSGVNSSKTENKSFFEIMDVNGDGLPDIVVKEAGNNYCWVKLNYGTSYGGADASQFEKWIVPSWGNGISVPDVLTYSSSNSTNATGGIEIPLPLPWSKPDMRFVVTPKLTASTSYSESSLSIQDINGDGLPDRLYKGSDKNRNKLYAQLNQSGRVNLLKKVEGPLGMSMAFDYERTNHADKTGNTVENPSSQYVLKSVAVENSHSTKAGCSDAINCKETYTTTFDYGAAMHDRKERTAYGFAWVKETQPDGTWTRTDFLNGYDEEHSYEHNINLANTYYTKGLAYKKESHRKDGSVYHREVTTYQLLGVSTAAGQVAVRYPAAVTQEFVYLEKEGSAKVNKVSYTYDEYGNVLSELDEGDDNDARDTTNLMIEYAPEDGRYIVGKPTLVRVFDVSTSQKLLRKRQAVYDETGNLKEFIAYSDDAVVSRSTLDYDAYGNIARLTGPNGYTLDYEYENVTFSQVARVSDSFGLSSQSENFDYRFGVATRTVDTNSNTIEYEYDNSGRMSRVWGPYLTRTDAASLEMHYYPGDVIPKAWTKNREDHEGPRTIDTVIFIDSLKRVIQTMKTSEVYANGQTVIGKTVTGRVIFDDMGRVTSQSQPVFSPGLIGQNTNYLATSVLNPTLFDYDDQGRTVKVETPDHSITTTAYSVEDGWMKTRVVDPEGKKKDSYADLYSKIRQIQEYIDGKAIRTSYVYSPVGEILEVKDDAGNSTRIDYDLLGRRLMIDNPDNGKTRFKYDEAGNLVEKITARLAAKNKSIKYEYEFNRLVKINNPGKEKDVLYTYGKPGAANNRAGRIVQISDESGLTELFYGRLGEVIQTDKTIFEEDYEEHKDREHEKLAKEQHNYTQKRKNLEHEQRKHEREHVKKFTTKQSWDSFGRMKQLTYPDGEVLTYTYDAGGLLQKATGKKDSKTFEYLKMLAYDEFGQRVFMDFGNNTQTRYQYDDKTRRLSSLQMKAPAREGGVKLLQSLTYRYDRVGNVLSITDGAINPVKQEFDYDDLYRLVAAHGTYERKARERHADHYGETSGKSPARGDDHEHGGEKKFHEYAQTFSYDNIHNMTKKTSMQRVKEIEGNSSHFVYSKENNYAYDYFYKGAKPHAVSSINVKLRPEKDRADHDRREFGQSHNKPHEYTINFNYDESGNLIDREMDKDDDKQDQGRSQGNSQHKRYLRWDSADRLKAVYEHEDHSTSDASAGRAEGKGRGKEGSDKGKNDRGEYNRQKLTTFTYNANGERVIKHGDKGETYYINQFYEVRDDAAVFKHIFAGNTRIATKMVEDEEHRKQSEKISGESRQVLPSNGQSNTQNRGVNPNNNSGSNGSGQNGNAPNDQGQGNANGRSNDKNNGNGNNPGTGKHVPDQRDGSKNSDSHGQKDKKNDSENRDTRDSQNNKDGNKDKESNRDGDKSKQNNADRGKNGNNGNHGSKRQNEGKGKNDAGQNSGNDQGAGGSDNTSIPADQGQGVSIGDVNQTGREKDRQSDQGRHKGHECGHEDDRGYRGHHDEACVYYYHGDHLGSSNYITDRTGRVFEHTIYLPYGETWIDEGHETSLLGYKFTGKELDEETGLYYFGARYYDPQVSNWISTDPIFAEYIPKGEQLFFPEQAFNAKSLKGAGGIFNSHNLNLYHYAGLNPLKMFDPDGNQEQFIDTIVKPGNDKAYDNVKNLIKNPGQIPEGIAIETGKDLSSKPKGPMSVNDAGNQAGKSIKAGTENYLKNTGKNLVLDPYTSNIGKFYSNVILKGKGDIGDKLIAVLGVGAVLTIFATGTPFDSGNMPFPISDVNASISINANHDATNPLTNLPGKEMLKINFSFQKKF